MNGSKKFSIRFDGGRFKNQRLPFNSLMDIALIERMVMDIASEVFIEENPERERAPRNFKKNYYLSMTDLTGGSTVVEFTISNRIPQQVFESGEEKSIEIAIDDFIDYWGNDLEEDKFKKRGARIKPHLRLFGQSLLDGEWMEFSSNNKKSIYDQEIRHKLIEKSTEYNDEIEIYGEVQELDNKSETFRLHYMEKGRERRVNVTLGADYKDSIHTALKEDNQKVFVRGTGNFKDQKLQKIEKIDDFQLLDPRDIQFKLNDLKNLGDGWFENTGKAPSAEGLTKLSELFDAYYTEDRNLPYIYPTPEGNLELEWSITDADVILGIDIDSLIGDLLIIYDDKDIQYDLNLNTSSDWKKLNDILKGVY